MDAAFAAKPDFPLMYERLRPVADFFIFFILFVLFYIKIISFISEFFLQKSK